MRANRMRLGGLVALSVASVVLTTAVTRSHAAKPKTTMALAVQKTSALDPKADRGAFDNVAHRNISVSDGAVDPDDFLTIRSLLPGYVVIPLDLDFWHGNRCWRFAGSEACYLRYEVYDPLDKARIAPIFTTESERFLNTMTETQSYSDERTVDRVLGPFPPREEPYTVRVYVMMGKDTAEPINRTNGKYREKNYFGGVERRVYVR